MRQLPAHSKLASARSIAAANSVRLRPLPSCATAARQISSPSVSSRLPSLTGPVCRRCPSQPRTVLSSMTAVASEQEESVACWIRCGAIDQYTLSGAPRR